MKQWVVATDRSLPAGAFRGEFSAVDLPDVEGYEPGDWIKIAVSAEPRRLWRLLCEERESV